MKRKLFGNLDIKNDPQARLLFALAALVFMTAAALLGWFVFSQWQGNAGWGDFDDASASRPASCDYRRVLDGVCVAAAEEVNPKLAAIMMENHVDSRPPSGLAEASVVYEAPVEANITRFLALYPADRTVEKVGPIRSARPYYLDWALEYGTPMYMHVGGSPEAMDKIERFGMFNMDEMTRGWYFWRSDERSAPHNTYTSSKLWNKALEDYGALYREEAYTGWMFSSSTFFQSAPRAANALTVSFVPPWYEATWRYSSSTGKYFRYQMNRPHADDDGTPVAADTVITQEVTIRVIDEIGRRSVETVGRGPARIFMGGFEIRGTWKKESRTARTRFVDENGNDIPLAPGKIWIEIIGSAGQVKTE